MTADASSAYRRTDGHSASPVRLVIMLYEQLVKDLQRAVGAMEKKDIACRTNELDHALVVVCQLQGKLDMERGGEVARNLDNYYYVLRACILQAQIQVQPVELRKHIQILLELREAWVQVERSVVETTQQPSRSTTIMHSPLEKAQSWSI